MKANLETLFKLVGLPEPHTEYKFHPQRRFRFDYAFPGDLLLAVELEGGTFCRGRHTRPRGYANDCFKYNEAALMGWVVLRFTVDMIRDGRALDQLQRAVERYERKRG